MKHPGIARGCRAFQPVAIVAWESPRALFARGDFRYYPHAQCVVRDQQPVVRNVKMRSLGK